MAEAGGLRSRTRLALRTGGVGLMALLGACTMLGPNFVTPKSDVAPSWTTKSAARVSHQAPQDSAWWKAFDDPTLDKLIELAYKQNLSLQQAGVDVLQARAQLGAAIGNEYPQKQGASGQLRYHNRGRNDDSVLPFGSEETSFSTLNYGLSSSWEIDFWGKFRRAVQSADQSFLASISNYDAALVSLTATVAGSYVSMRTAQARIRVLHANVAAQEVTLRIARARFKAGETGERDVTQAQSQLADTKAQIPALEVSVAQDEHMLAALLGMTSAQFEPLLGASGPIPTAPEQVAAGIPRDLLRRRPDVRQAEHVAAAQCALIGVNEANLYPAFSLSGTFGFSSTTIARHSLSDAFGWNGRTFGFGPALQWNLFNYGQITNQVRAQDAQFQAAVLSYQNAVLQAQREVEDALVAFVKAGDTVGELEKAVAAAKRSLQLSLVQYREGATDFTTVLVSEQALLNQQDQLTIARGNVPQSLIDVYQALGGGWQIREGKAFVAPSITNEMKKRTDWGDLLEVKSLAPPTAEQRKALFRKPDW